MYIKSDFYLCKWSKMQITDIGVILNFLEIPSGQPDCATDDMEHRNFVFSQIFEQ